MGLKTKINTFSEHFLKLMTFDIKKYILQLVHPKKIKFSTNQLNLNFIKH